MWRKIKFIILPVVLLLSILLNTPSAHASTTAWGYINWQKINKGCQAQFYLQYWNTSHPWQRNVRCEDPAAGDGIEVGVISNNPSFCGPGLFFFWDDARPGFAIHCRLMQSWNYGDTMYVAAYPTGTIGTYAIINEDLTTGDTQCLLNCYSVNNDVRFTDVSIREHISNWSGSDALDTTTWWNMRYNDGFNWYNLTSSGSSIHGNNPPWIGWIRYSTTQAYSCSLFASTNPC